MYVIINKDGIIINANVNLNNLSIKEYMIKDLFGVLAVVNMNVINHVMLENI